MGLFKRRDNQIRPSSKSNKSINSSTGSMTRSQLNLAIMDMLNLSQSTHGCDYVCRGKSMSEAFKTISRSGYLTHFQRIEHDLKKKPTHFTCMYERLKSINTQVLYVTCHNFEKCQASVHHNINVS